MNAFDLYQRSKTQILTICIIEKAKDFSESPAGDNIRLLAQSLNMSQQGKSEPGSALAWQTASRQPGAEESTQDIEKVITAPTTQNEEPRVGSGSSTDQDALLELANRFLQDPSIQDAPTDKKMAFLASKGVSQAAIERAMGLTKAGIKDSPLTQASNTSTTFPSTSAPPPPPSPQSRPVAQPPTTPAVAPIITYPEFLLSAKKPPPLITIQRVTNTAYALGVISATIYGASRYLINPMLSALTSARHEFAEHAQGQLKTLNTKLEDVVSVDPRSRRGEQAPAREATAEEEDSATHLFSREIGTQTTPPPSSPTGLSTPSETSGDNTTSSSRPQSAVDTETNTLAKLNTLLTDANTSSRAEAETSRDVHKALAELTQYVMGLSASSYIRVDAPYGGAKEKKEEDEVAKVKAEIRGVKGVLLSARNFPSAASREDKGLNRENGKWVRRIVVQ